MPERRVLQPPDQRRLFSLISFLTLMTLCSVIGAVPAWAQQPAGSARIVVNDVTGTLPAKPQEPAVVHVGDNLVQNEVIDTAPNSATLAVFQDNSRLAICPSAEVVINRAEYGPNSTGPTLVVFIAKGCTRFSSGPLLKTALFRTPSAEIQIVGTILTVTVSARGTTVSVAEGTASVTGAGRSVAVAAGRSTLVSRGAPPTPPVPTPPEPPIVAQMNTLLMTASAQDFGTRAAARSPAVEAPTDAGTNTFTPNVDGKIQSEIAGDATPGFSNGTHSGAPGSNGTHTGVPGSNGTHGSAGSNGTH